MRKTKVRHEALPGIGDVFELDTASGPRITVISHRSGRRDLAIGPRNADEPLVTTALTRTEAAAIALLLAGVHVELAMTTRD